MKKFSLIFFLPVLFACAQVPAKPEALSSQIPQIDMLVPLEETTLTTTSRMAVLFSKPIDRSSISEQSLLLVHGVIAAHTPTEISQLYSAIDRQKLEQVPLQVSFSNNKKVVILRPADALIPNERYTLLLTPRILSQDRLPLSQGFSNIPFQASYVVVASAASTSSSETTPPTTSPLAANDPERMIDEILNNNGQEDPTTIPNPPTTPVVSPPGSTAGVPPTDTTGVVPPPASDEPQAPAVATDVLINEIYYDAVGSDTDGVLFVELFGTPGGSLAGYKILFVNGSDGSIYDTIILPQNARLRDNGFYVVADARTGDSIHTQVANADLIDNFDPQNGPDSIQLCDSTDHLLDVIGYGEEIEPQSSSHLASFLGGPAVDVVNGHSLERGTAGQDTQNNAADFVDRPTPTPGQ